VAPRAARSAPSGIFLHCAWANSLLSNEMHNRLAPRRSSRARFACAWGPGALRAHAALVCHGRASRCSPAAAADGARLFGARAPPRPSAYFWRAPPGTGALLRARLRPCSYLVAT
jgi:hypothetical protein